MRKQWLGTLLLGCLFLLAPQLAWPEESKAFSSLTAGKDSLENPSLPTIDGGQASLLDLKKGANVFIFFRSGAEPSRLGLAEIGKCMAELSASPVHWVALVSDRDPVEAVKAMVAESRFSGPVLIDNGNALYGKFGVRLHPTVGITDQKGLLTAYQPYAQINFCAQVKAQVLRTLGKISEEELQRQLNPAATVDPKNDDSKASRNLKMGERFFAAGNYEQALAAAQRSLELAPDLPEAHGLAALSLASQKQCAEAAEHQKQALAGNPQEAKALEAQRLCR
ncbi:MAG: hypothetical protein V1782_04375 [Pseudomonadota bacterium]